MFGESSFVKKNDGTLWACGYNRYGQLGLGDKTDRDIFEKVNIDNVEAISGDMFKIKLHSIIRNKGEYVTFLDSRFENLGKTFPVSEVVIEKGMDNLSVILEKQPEKQSKKTYDSIGSLGDGFIDKCIINKSDYRDIKEMSVRILK